MDIKMYINSIEDIDSLGENEGISDINGIAREFNCRIYDIRPLRAVHVVQTDRGTMILKECSRDPDKILYSHGLKEHLYNNGFENIDRYELSIYDLPFVIRQNRVFVMEKYINGRECSFTNPYDREKIVKALADMHNRGEGYVPGTGAARRNNLGRWDRAYLKKINDLSYFKQLAAHKRKKSRFDKDFLSDVDFFIEMGWKGYDTLRRSDYHEICRQGEEEKVICHHDYTYHNIIIDDCGRVSVIDFDYSCHELPVYDLSALIMKVLKRFNYDIDIAIDMINHYCRVAPLEDGQLALMLSLFEFPQRFWRISERYYSGKDHWSESIFLKKYNDIIVMKEFIKDYTENFRRILGL